MTRRRIPAGLAAAVLLGTAFLLGAGSALAAPDGWHRTLEDGQKAARSSGKPILVVTAWPDNL